MVPKNRDLERRVVEMCELGFYRIYWSCRVDINGRFLSLWIFERYKFGDAMPFLMTLQPRKSESFAPPADQKYSFLSWHVCFSLRTRNLIRKTPLFIVFANDKACVLCFQHLGSSDRVLPYARCCLTTLVSNRSEAPVASGLHGKGR